MADEAKEVTVKELTDEEAEKLQEELDKVKGKLKPNSGNGADLPNYSWTQTSAEIKIHITFNVSFKLKCKDVVVEFQKKHLKAGLKGHRPIIDGETYSDINPAWGVSTWELKDSKEIVITLVKLDEMKWSRVVTTDPEIDLEIEQSEVDTKSIQITDNSELPDEDDKFDENNEKRQEAIKNFKEKYPGIDLAKCTFS